MKIGLVDSGIGLLAAAAAVRRMRGDADLVLASDPEGMPWGPRSPQDVASRALACARAAAAYGLDALIVACNTASVHALPALRAEFEPGLPIVGTVPGDQAGGGRAPHGRDLGHARDNGQRLPARPDRGVRQRRRGHRGARAPAWRTPCRRPTPTPWRPRWPPPRRSLRRAWARSSSAARTTSWSPTGSRRPYRARRCTDRRTRWPRRRCAGSARTGARGPAGAASTWSSAAGRPRCRTSALAYAEGAALAVTPATA